MCVLGKTYGRLTVTKTTKGRNPKKHYFRCVCACGNEVIVESWNLRSGNTKSCGCWQRQRGREAATTHGGSKSLTYASWASVKQRCLNTKAEIYADYGARGIRMCERWKSFENFRKDMGERPSRQHSIDRIDGAKGYEPGNCRWATATEQARNRRSNRLLTFRGETMTLAGWVEKTGLSRATIRGRLRRGWSIVDTLTKQKSDGSHSRRPKFKVAV